MVVVRASDSVSSSVFRTVVALASDLVSSSVFRTVVALASDSVSSFVFRAVVASGVCSLSEAGSGVAGLEGGACSLRRVPRPTARLSQNELARRVL